MTDNLTPLDNGYRYGLRQPGNIMHINVRFDVHHVDIVAIDRFLFDDLNVNIDPEPDFSSEFSRKDAQTVCSMVWRVLMLSRYFLQTVRLPVFDAGVVLNVNQGQHDGMDWDARIAVPYPVRVSSRGIAHSYRSAVEVMHMLVGNINGSNLSGRVRNFIQKSVLEPLWTLTSPGISTFPLLHAAYRRDIPFRHLNNGVYQLGWGENSRLIDRSSIDSDSAIGSTLTKNKKHTADLLRMGGLPAPEHLLVSRLEHAFRAVEELGWPVVVKPADKERGEGVSVSINNRDDLVVAYRKAAKVSKKILIEREVPGVCYRLLIANGKMLYAIRRGPRSIEGDGVHTVSSLVHRANSENKARPPWLQDKNYPFDQLAHESMASAGYSPESIPDKGVWVPLRQVESTEWGGHIEDVSELVHPENKKLAEAAASLFGLDNAGIDLIATDIATSWHDAGSVINEVNYAPYFGGNDIARALIPAYLQSLFGDDARIPVEIFTGSDDAVLAAERRQQSLIRLGIQCFMTTHRVTYAPSGEEVLYPFESLFNRVTALTMNKALESLIVVVQTDEFLKTGMPVDRVSSFIKVNDALVKWNDPGNVLDPDARNALFELIDMYCVRPARTED